MPSCWRAGTIPEESSSAWIAASPAESPPTNPTPQTARYRQLFHRLRPYATWLAFVARNDRILNCGEASTRPLAVRFRYECPHRWETMAPTPEAGARYCVGCRRNVYFCDTTESVERHALAGDCIAVPQHLTASVRRELTEKCTGMPDVYELWGERIARRAGPSRSGEST